MSTKECPICGNANLVLMRGHSLKRCTDCGVDIPWRLNDGQKPIPRGARPEPIPTFGFQAEGCPQ